MLALQCGHSLRSQPDQILSNLKPLSSRSRPNTSLRVSALGSARALVLALILVGVLMMLLGGPHGD